MENSTILLEMIQCRKYSSALTSPSCSNRTPSPYLGSSSSLMNSNGSLLCCQFFPPTPLLFLPTCFLVSYDIKTISILPLHSIESSLSLDLSGYAISLYTIFLFFLVDFLQFKSTFEVRLFQLNVEQAYPLLLSKVLSPKMDLKLFAIYASIKHLSFLVGFQLFFSNFFLNSFLLLLQAFNPPLLSSVLSFHLNSGHYKILMNFFNIWLDLSYTNGCCKIKILIRIVIIDRVVHMMRYSLLILILIHYFLSICFKALHLYLNLSKTSIQILHFNLSFKYRLF